MMKDRISWIMQDVAYENMSEQYINSEYKKLKETLKQMNAEIVKLLERSQLHVFKSPPKQTNPQHTMEVRDREVENNRKMLSFYKAEYAKLMKRVSYVGYASKEDAEKEIFSIQQKISYIVKEIKQLKKKNLMTGNSIADGDQLIVEMRNLEYQKIQFYLKKMKLAKDLDRVLSYMDECRTKTLDAKDKFERADSVLRYLSQKDMSYRYLQQIYRDMILKRSQLEGAKKKMESVRVQYEQKYLNKLRELDNATITIKKTSSRIYTVYRYIIEAKQLILDLEAKTAKRDSVQESEGYTLFLTKPMEFSYYQKNSQDELFTQKDTMVLTTVDEKEDFLAKSHTVAVCQKTHYVQIGTEIEIEEEYKYQLADEQAPAVTTNKDAKMVDKPTSAALVYNPVYDSEQYKKRRLLYKLKAFYMEDSV